MSNIDFRRLGHRVIYTLNEGDAHAIIAERRNAGQAVKRGNDPKAGQSFPGVIVADFGTATNLAAALQFSAEKLREQYAMSQGAPTTNVIGYPSEFKGMTSQEFESSLQTRLAKIEIDLKNAAKVAGANIQVQLDGTDTYWATSRSQFDPDTHGRLRYYVDGTPITDYQYEQLAGPNDVGAGEATRVEKKWIPDSEGHFIDLDA